MSFKTGARAIKHERERQIAVKGYLPKGDEGRWHELMAAADCYLWVAQHPEASHLSVPSNWPWESEYWHPSGLAVRNLVKAGALIAAALDSRLSDSDSRRGSVN